MLKVNCKGKRTVGKANKGINIEKIIGLKNKKLKFKKREKKKKKRKTPETSKSPPKRQRFMTIKKVTEEKEKKKLKSLTGFLSANKIDNYNRGGKKEEKKRKNPKESTEQVKKKNNKYFCSVTAVRVLSLAGNHSPP